MIYLTGCIPKKPELRKFLLENGFGVMLSPVYPKAPDNQWVWAADNGCFNAKWEEKKWFKWLGTLENPETAMFATVPDVVGDHTVTLERWNTYSSKVRDMGFVPAFVAQDGATVGTIPWDEVGYLFIGGTTEFKLSEQARTLCVASQERQIKIHMGRVNSKKRLKLAKQWGVDTADGTHIAFKPDVYTHQLIQWMKEINEEHDE